MTVPKTRSGTELATGTPDTNLETKSQDKKVPKTIEEALKIDVETGTDHWRQAMDKEPRAVAVAFEACSCPQWKSHSLAQMTIAESNKVDILPAKQLAKPRSASCHSC